MKKISPIYYMCIAIIGFSGCQRKPRQQTPVPQTLVKPEQPAPVVVQQKAPSTPIAYSERAFKKETDSEPIVRPVVELNEYIKRLNPEDVLTCVYDLLFVPGYTIEEKCAVLEGCKNRLKDSECSVVDFFVTVLTQHADFLKNHPLTDLNNSLVSYAPEHAEFLKEDEEMTEMLWPIDEIYASGNNLLQEAILLKNEAAIDYLLTKGADPRHLCDARGTMLALEWVDKHEIQTIAGKLAQTLNKLDPDSKTTILDELIYTDSHAANLVRKYGGKLSSELT